MLLSSDHPRAVGQSLGLGVIGLTGALSRLSPDIVVLLGDRYEALAAAQSAMILGIPIAHLHGGEVTEGAIDEAIRHAITKMAHIHFVAAEPFRRRVIQLGERPDRVHVVGAMGLDNMADLDPMPRADLEQALGLQLDSPVLLVTYHPVTLAKDGAAGVAAMLEALDGQTGARIVFTGVNADALGQEIEAKIEAFCRSRPERCVQVVSLGFHRYLSLMALSAVVVGNSSSGLLEAPSMGISSVNIGPRQRGRPRAPSVIDCDENAGEIAAALSRAMSSKMQEIASRRETPYGSSGASHRVAEELRMTKLDDILMKRFHDL
jgi:UDP-N-acetylglucosamine 2-epimerase (non-hydrolysing)